MSWKDNGPRWPGRGTEHFKDGALLGVGKVRTKGLAVGGTEFRLFQQTFIALDYCSSQ